MSKLNIKIDDSVVIALWAHNITPEQMAEYFLKDVKSQVVTHIQERVKTIKQGETK